MIKKIIVIILIILLIIILIIFLRPMLTGMTGKVIESNKEYIYTKAICNSSNFCQDNEITCRNKEVVSIAPITGAVIQHPQDWKDTRNSTELCEYSQ